MELVKPDIGLLFWMTTCFLILLVILRKFAWGPILNALNEREKGIQHALDEASRAREEINSLQDSQQKILNEAKEQREEIISEAKKFAEEYKVVKKDAIDKEMAKRLEGVQDTIEKEKQAALDSIKKGVASLSVEIAEKILEKKLESDSIQEELINNGLEKLDIK